MVELANINILAVIITALLPMVLGSLWYSPLLFGKTWMAMMGITKKNINKKSNSMTNSYVIALIGALVTSYVLAHFVDYLGANTFGLGMQTGFWVWLGFVATSMLGTVIWEGKPWKLYLINAGYYFISLPLMGGILAVWN